MAMAIVIMLAYCDGGCAATWTAGASSVASSCTNPGDFGNPTYLRTGLNPGGNDNMAFDEVHFFSAEDTSKLFTVPSISGARLPKSGIAFPLSTAGWEAFLWKIRLSALIQGVRTTSGGPANSRTMTEALGSGAFSGREMMAAPVWQSMLRAA